MSSTTCEDTALLEHQQVIYDARSLSPYLNSRTATTALTQDIDDFADIYPSLRRYWYDTFSLQQEFGVSVSGTTLTFDRNTEFTTTGNLATTTTNNVINLMDTTPTLTGDNTTFDFGTVTVDWNSITPPSGITLSGGTHNELPAPSMLNLTTQGTVVMNVAGGTSTPVTFDSLFGDITIGSGTLTMNNTSGSNVNVQINEADVPTGFVFGTNFTRVDVPVGAIIETVTVPAHAEVGGFYHLIITKGTGNTGGTPTVSGATVGSRQTITAGTDVVITMSSANNWETGDQLDIYVKYNSDVVNTDDDGSLIFQEQRIRINFGDGGGRQTVALPITTALVGSIAAPANANADKIRTASPAEEVSDGVDYTYFVTLEGTDGDTLSLNQFQSQGFAAQVANDPDYFDAFVAQASGEVLFRYAAANGIEWNTNVFAFETSQLTAADDDGNVFRRQQTVTNWSVIPSNPSFSSRTRSRTGAPEVLSVEAQQAALATVTDAVDAATIGQNVSAIRADTSAIREDARDTKNAVAWTMRNTSGTDTALNSWIPQPANFDRNADYSANVEPDLEEGS